MRGKYTFRAFSRREEEFARSGLLRLLVVGLSGGLVAVFSIVSG